MDDEEMLSLISHEDNYLEWWPNNCQQQEHATEIECWGEEVGKANYDDDEHNNIYYSVAIPMENYCYRYGGKSFLAY